MNHETATDISSLSLEGLINTRSAYVAEMERWKGYIVLADAAIAVKTKTAIESAILASGKEHGTINTPLGGGLTAKIEIAKKVDWDSAKLTDIATKSMSFERAQQVFKIEFSMAEKVYDGLKIADPVLTAKLDAARTVSYGKPKVTISSEAKS